MKSFSFSLTIFLFAWIFGPLTLSCTQSQTTTDQTTEGESEELKRQELARFKQLAEANADAYAKMPYFPAEVSANRQFFFVQVTAVSGMFFADELYQHDLYGNGYCWAGIIEQLLEEKNKRVLELVTFDPEGDVCFISCPDEATMNELAATIHEFCATKEDFLKLLESIDKSRLDC